MAHYYFDGSALVKKYVAETGTAWVSGLCVAGAGHIVYTARIFGAEIVAALFRRVQSRTLDLTDAQTIATQFKVDFRQQYQIVEITEQLIDSAMNLAERHNLRGYDAVQLAAAIELQNVRTSLSLSAITFVCADDRLNQAAFAEGLQTDNPNSHL